MCAGDHDGAGRALPFVTTRTAADLGGNAKALDHIVVLARPIYTESCGPTRAIATKSEHIDRLGGTRYGLPIGASDRDS